MMLEFSRILFWSGPRTSWMICLTLVSISNHSNSLTLNLTFCAMQNNNFNIYFNYYILEGVCDFYIFTRQFNLALMRVGFIILGLVSLFRCSLSQILAVDFGTEYVKSAVVNSGTGKSFSIVHNSKSERKFLNAIGFYNQERFYESQSLSKRPKLPTNCFIFNKLLIDSAIDSQIPSKVKRDLLLEYVKEDGENHLMAKFILEKFPEEYNELSLIEVVAMIMKYAKWNAQNQIKTPIKDVILTVPNYWNIKMREFMIEAAEVADLYVLSLISENTGAAINYALNQRSKNTTEKILFINLGSNSLQMTIAQFRQVAQEKGKPIQSIFVLGDYGKPYVGGLKLDQIVYGYFLNKFEKKYNRELSKKGKIKLFLESNQMKEVLSANKDATLFVEGIMDGIDFMEKITRAEFQSLSIDALNQITSPIKRFLFDYDLKPEDLDGVQLIGGSIRMPKIQDMITEIIKDKQKIGTHINGDEAMVLGAAFYGANSSKKFKVKGIHLYDGFNFEIRAVIRNLDENLQEGDEGYIFKNVTVFNKKTRFGITKEINFRSKHNIIVEFYQEDENGINLLRQTKIDSIEKVNETDFKVSLTLSLDPIEIVSIKKSQITYKKDEVQTYLEKVKKPRAPTEEKERTQEDSDTEAQQQNSEQEKKNEEETVSDEEPKEQVKDEEKSEQSEEKKSEQNEDESEKEEKEESQKEDEENKEEQGSKDQENKENRQEKKQKKKKKKKEDEYQTVEKNKTVTKKYERQIEKQELFTFRVKDKERNEKSKKILLDYEQRQQAKRKLSEAKNKLESLIYEGKQKMENEQFLQFVQESQKTKIQELIAQKSTWLDETMSNDSHEYNDQYKTLNRPIDKIKKRINEYNQRQIEKKKAKKEIQEYKNLTKKIREKKDWISEEQVQELLQKIEESNEEIDSMYEKMTESAKSQNAVYLIKDFTKATQKAKDEYFKLMATQKPKKEKKEEEKKEDSSQDLNEQL